MSRLTLNNNAANPSAPAADKLFVFSKTDKKLYIEDADGLVSPLAVASGASASTFTLGSTSIALASTTTTVTALTLSGGTLSGTTTLTGMTTGSVLFAGASSALSQDNANLFWDDTNNRLGIGSTSPLAPFFINAARAAFKGQMVIQDPTAVGSSNASAVFFSAYGNDGVAGSTTGRKWYLGNPNAGTDNSLQLFNAQNDFIAFGTNNTERVRIYAGGDWRQGSGSAIATTATDGFLLMATCAGAPTGTPTNAGAGQIPFVYDKTNNRIYAYNGSWRMVAVA